MSMAKLRERDLPFADVVSTGLRWKVLRWQVRVMYPQALDFLQRARNVPSTTFRQESEMQGLMRLHTLSARAQSQGLPPPFKEIKSNMLRSKPPFADSLDEMIAFVVARAGGPEGKFLKYLNAFHRSHVDSRRTSLPAALYLALADAKEHYLALAVFQAAWQCPDDQVHSGVCRGFSASDVLSMHKSAERLRSADLQRRELIAQAEHACMSARLLLKDAGIVDDWDSARLCKCLARFDISLVRYLFNRQGGAKNKFRSISDVGQLLKTDLAAAFPDARVEVYDAIFGKETAAAASGPPEASGPQQAGLLFLHAVDEQGAVVEPIALLRSKGFDIGFHAGSKADPATETLYLIHEIASSQSPVRVVLQDAKASDLVRKVDLPEFLEKWEVRDAKQQTELHKAWPEKRPTSTLAFRTLARRSSICSALAHAAWKIECDVGDRVHIVTKPARKVTAACDVPAFGLVLLPETLTVKSRLRNDDATEMPAGALEVRMLPADDTCEHYLLPCAGSDMVAPLWLVNTTEEQMEANLAWTTVQVQVLTGHDFVGPMKPMFETLGKAAPLKNEVSGQAAPPTTEASGQAAPLTAKAKADAKKAQREASKAQKEADKEQKDATKEQKSSGKGKGKQQPPVADVAEVHEGEEMTATELVILLPALVNVKALCAGDELRVYKAPGPKRSKGPAASIAVSALAKRAKKA
jgi:hypothetical protein